MDCLFNWPRRPNAVLMGTKQVGTQRSYFGDPRGQTCRGLTLTFWSAFSASALALHGLGKPVAFAGEDHNVRMVD